MLVSIWCKWILCDTRETTKKTTNDNNKFWKLFLTLFWSKKTINMTLYVKLYETWHGAIRGQGTFNNSDPYSGVVRCLEWEKKEVGDLTLNLYQFVTPRKFKWQRKYYHDSKVFNAQNCVTNNLVECKFGVVSVVRSIINTKLAEYFQTLSFLLLLSLLKLLKLVVFNNFFKKRKTRDQWLEYGNCRRFQKKKKRQISNTINLKQYSFLVIKQKKIIIKSKFDF